MREHPQLDRMIELFRSDAASPSPQTAFRSRCNISAKPAHCLYKVRLCGRYLAMYGCTSGPSSSGECHAMRKKCNIAAHSLPQPKQFVLEQTPLDDFMAAVEGTLAGSKAADVLAGVCVRSAQRGVCTAHLGECVKYAKQRACQLRDRTGDGTGNGPMVDEDACKAMRSQCRQAMRASSLRRPPAGTSAAECPPWNPPATPRCDVRGTEPVRIALCFYGVSRNVSRVLPSLDLHLLPSLRAAGSVDVFVHALRTPHVLGSYDTWNDNAWSGCGEDMMLLAPCAVAVAEQSEVDLTYELPRKVRMTANASAVALSTYSQRLPVLLNIYRSRFSLGRVAALVKARERGAGFRYTHVVATRPDVTFFSKVAWLPLSPGIRVPNFGHGSAAGIAGGVNDRFAYGDAPSMLSAYMTQFDEQLNDPDGAFMHDSENLMCKHLVRHRISVGALPICMVRIRANGALITEDFRRPRRAPTRCQGLDMHPSLASDDINPCPPFRGIANAPQ